MSWVVWASLVLACMAGLYAVVLPRVRAQSSRRGVAQLCLAVASACFGRIAYDGAALDALQIKDKGKTIEWRTVVSDKLCTTASTSPSSSGGKGRFLSCGAAAALFDELTTMVLMTSDRCVRGSVSVTLSVHLHKRIPAGTNVLFKAHARKTGRNLSFMDAYIYSADGKELLAQGSHVKFMVNHFLLNLLTHINSILRPWASQQLLNYLVAPRAKKEGGILDDEDTLDSLLASCMNLSNPSNSKPNKEENVSDLNVKVIPQLQNIYNKMHGGAAAILIERCASRSIKNNKDVVSMTLSYSKAVSDPAVVTVQGEDNVESVFSTVVISRKGKLCTSANLTWGALE